MNKQVHSDFDFSNSKLSESWDELITGTGSSVVNVNGYINMLTSAVGSRVVRQSKEYWQAKSYKYNIALFTAVLNISTSVMPSGRVSARSRIGVFDDNTDKVGDSTDFGFFFEYRITDRTTGPSPILNPLYIGIRYNSTFTRLGDRLISQSNFNNNDLNRQSHIRISEWSKIYTFEIKYNAIGRVEWSIYIDGERILLHQELDITNILSTLPKVNLPLRFEIDNRLVANGGLNNEISPDTTNAMRQFHASMIYEADTNMTNIKYLRPTNNVLYAINSQSYAPVVSIRLKSAFNRRPIRIYEISYLVNKRAPFIYAVVRNGIPNNPTWTNPNANSYLEYDQNSTSLSNYTDIIYEQFVDSSTNNGVQQHKKSIIDNLTSAIASNISGTADIFTIVARNTTTTTSSAIFGFKWVQD